MFGYFWRSAGEGGLSNANRRTVLFREKADGGQLMQMYVDSGAKWVWRSQSDLIQYQSHSACVA